MQKPLIALSLAALVTLAGCAAQPTAPASTAPAAPAASAPAAGAQSDVLATVGLAGLTGRQIVDKLDQDPAARPLKMKASVRPDHVVIGSEAGEVNVPIEGENSFYLSIAPYATQTHECHFHSLASCRGEMKSAPVHVKIVDSAGKVLVDEDVTTYANGFVGFWLPKGIKGTVTATADGKTGSVPFATGPEDATCLTTLQVS